MVRKALGRGLDALLPDRSGEEGRELPPGQEIPIDLIDFNPDQPRTSLDSQALKELAQSIKEKGVIQPLVVKQAGDRFQLIAGERRLRACEIAGVNTVPVVVKDVADDELLILALIENIQREDLNAIEEAMAYETLIKQQGLTQEQLSEVIGKDRSTIANSLRLLRLPDYALDALSESKLSGGHARAILMMDDQPAEMKKLFNAIISKGLSVREAESYVKKIKEKKEDIGTVSKIAEEPDPFIKDAEDRLCKRLSTKVNIVRQKSGAGKIILNFASDEDLQRLFELLQKIHY